MRHIAVFTKPIGRFCHRTVIVFTHDACRFPYPCHRVLHLVSVKLSAGGIIRFFLIVHEEIDTSGKEVHGRGLEELVRKRIPIFCDVAKEILQTELNMYRNINVPRRYPMGEEKLEKLECFGEDDNINDLLYAKVFVRLKNRYTGNEEIKYFCPQKLPELKYIVLSATLNEKIYRAYFAGDMRVYMYPEKKAAYKGKVVQYTYHSLGRNDLSDKRQVFLIVRAWPCSPLRSFSLIRKTELWRTNKPPALRVVKIALALCKKPPLI